MSSLSIVSAFSLSKNAITDGLDVAPWCYDKWDWVGDGWMDGIWVG